MREDILEILQSKWKYRSFRPLQEDIIICTITNDIGRWRRLQALVLLQRPPGLKLGTVREAASRDGSQRATRPTGEYVPCLDPSLSIPDGGDRPGARQVPLTSKKGAGGGAPSLIAAEVGRDRSQPPFSAFGADGRGHR